MGACIAFARSLAACEVAARLPLLAKVVRPMNILQVHNRYRQPGGEDTVLANEARLLREHGHEVHLLEAHNDAQDPAGLVAKARLACNTVWSASGARAMADALARFKPDVVHVHNSFNQFSPVILRTATAQGVATVQTLHNYRVACANGLLLRDGRPCELCLTDGRLQAVKHRCYRGSALGSAVVSLTGALHLQLGTYARRGLRVVALTEFAHGLLLRAGIGESVLRIKPNFVYPAAPQLQGLPRDMRVVFVGRLAAEKGVDLLLDAWRRLAPPGWTLELIGDGELRPADAELGASVRCLGWLDPAEVLARVASARYLVMASRWYEGLPMVLLEALSVGTPILVPRLGAMAELVTEGQDGHAFNPGDPADMAAVLGRALLQPPAAWQALSDGALRAYQQKFSPQANLQLLMGIYREAMDEVAR